MENFSDLIEQVPKIRTSIVKLLPSKFLVKADCLHLKEHLGNQRFDLIYLDPPFCTNTVLKSASRVDGIGKENEFDDRFGSLKDYSRWLRARLTVLCGALSSTGVIAIHLDYRAISIAHEILGSLLGYENQIGEIIWQYGLGGGKATKNYARKHNSILLWARDLQRVVVLEDTIQRFGTVWNIQSLNPMSMERVGYPTQKPLELLTRLISLFPESKSLLDPFCGSGTSLCAAENLKLSSWVGLDKSQNAIQMSALRLRKAISVRKHETLRDGAEVVDAAV
jgi:site-specific DNA-methyltransferase (adenine-specific)